MPLPSVAEVQRRLVLLFPEGVADRRLLTREIAAKTVLAFLFVRAVGDPNAEDARLLRPSMVTWADDESIRRADDRLFVEGWHAAASRRQADLLAFLEGEGIQWVRWAAENSRETIRDEVIRPLNERFGAVLRRSGVAASAASPALTLALDFAAVFDDGLDEAEILRRAAEWRDAHLSASERARLAALRRLAAADAVVVGLPGRGNRYLPPGAASRVTAAVINSLSRQLLHQPFVLAVCHSRDPVAAEDARELEQAGLSLDPSVALPDVLLFDAKDGRFWFVEVVVTGGEITERRKAELEAWAASCGIRGDMCGFVSAYVSRTDAVFRRTVGELAWGTYAWLADEPHAIVTLGGLADLVE